MSLSLKPLDQQVIVLTGASSGIGLVTARLAAQRGARLVLVARNEEALRQLRDEINAENPNQAIYLVADVGNEAAIDGVAQQAMQHFGRIDTWINNAGVGLYGELLVVPTQDSRRLFDTNFWGVVYGSLAAARHMQSREDGSAGAIINIGSEVSDRAVILIGMYSASKHAVKGFTDALRMELEAAKAPISVTLVKPSATNTPFPNHAQNLLDQEPTLPDPVYDPMLVAEAILYAAQTPVRDIYPTGAGLKTAVQGALMPRLTDWFMERSYIQKQRSGRPPIRRDDALYRPTTGLRERSESRRGVRRFSAYGLATRHPGLATAVVFGVGVLTIGVLQAVARNGISEATRQAWQQ
jgi:short-subunit dehydrogenase